MDLNSINALISYYSYVQWLKLLLGLLIKLLILKDITKPLKIVGRNEQVVYNDFNINIKHKKINNA